MHFTRYNENSEKEDRTLHLIGPDKRENAMDNHISSRALLHRRDVIKNNPRFGEAITEHYRINDAIYKNNPCFTKRCFRNHAST